MTTTQPPTSPPRGEPQANPQRRHDGRIVGIRRLPHAVTAHLAVTCILLSLPCSQPAFAAPTGQALPQQIQLAQAQAGAGGAGAVNLTQQPDADWISRLVEFLSAVPPECRAVANQQPGKECEHRQRGVLEQFKDVHPVAFNLLVAALTLLAGFQIGGGFKGGKRK